MHREFHWLPTVQFLKNAAMLGGLLLVVSARHP